MDSHALNLQPCHVKDGGKVLKKVEKDKSSTKLLVKNVAFEATEKDLRQLFSPFGQVIVIKSDNLVQLLYKYSFFHTEYVHLVVCCSKYSIFPLSLIFDCSKTCRLKA